MRKVLLVHISSSGCCNTLVRMLNNGDFWLSILFHSRVFHPCRLVPRFSLPRFPPLQSGAAFSTPASSTPAVWCRVFHSRVFSAPFTVIY